MLVQKDKVVSIHYTLKDKDGKIIDTSSGRDPLTYLHGNGNLIPGMEEGLEGTEEYGEKSFWLTLFHPNVLGMLLVLLIAAFAVFTLGGKAQ